MAHMLHVPSVDQSFPVAGREINACLGTNGAGKTSLLEAIELKRNRMLTCPG